MILGTQDGTISRETRDDEIRPLRAERAALEAQDEADRALLEELGMRADARTRRWAEIDDALRGTVHERVVLTVELDETTGEVVKRTPDGVEVVRVLAGDEVLQSLAGEKQPADVRALAAKLIEARAVAVEAR